MAVSADLYYEYQQMAPAAIWTIVHNLNKYPNVSVVDSAGNWVIGDVAYVSGNILTVRFSAAFAGTAYLN
jgi:hypothetical protein